MNDFFKFYSGSLSGTIIVIILFLFIRFLLRKQSNHIKIMLWVILLIRLLFPVSIYTEYGILYSETFVEKNENLSAQEMKSDDSLQIFPKDENTSKPYMGKKKNINILMILWYIGLLVFAVYYIILYRGLLFVEEQRMQRRYLHRMKSMSGKKAWLVLSA